MKSRTLVVSPNRRFLQTAEGQPFFWLADTAWEIFHRLDRSGAETYLRNRAARGFTVIQGVLLAEFDGLGIPNAYGHRPLEDNDPTKPIEAYFEHCDFVVRTANALGLTIALLPTWGDKWNRKWGVGPEIFTPANARAYGKWVGARYREADVVWVLGGDREVENEGHAAIIRAMAEGIRESVGNSHLITFHPQGGQTSAKPFHQEPWLDFNMWQSGHDRNKRNDECIDETYRMAPVKPCLDAEPGYEDHPAGFNLDNGYLDAYDNRKAFYWAVFAGACGHTYGCHDIWQFLSLGKPGVTWARTPWPEAVLFPGAAQMEHGKNLVLSRPYFDRVPDQGLVHGEVKGGTRRVRATRDASGTYAFVYFPTPEPVEISVASLRSKAPRAWWFDPRTGLSIDQGLVPAHDGEHEWLRRAGDVLEVRPPSVGPDWVLVLDDPAAGYGRPGA